MGVWLGAGAADNDFDSVTDSIDEAPVARRKSDGQQVGFAGFTEGKGVAFRMGGETTAEVAVEGFVVCEVDSWGLAVKSDATDAAFLPQDGATDLVIAIGARRGGSLGETEGKLDPFVFHG